MAEDEREKREEIIIVKRVIAGGDGHHGGAWKIAFADFMTAMMALFLVLWLVNAANEETKKSVASYFNPVKLVDRNRSSKGLEQSTALQTPEKKEGDEKGEGESKEVVQIEDADKNERKGTKADDELFEDPFKILDEIAMEQEEKIASSQMEFESIEEFVLPADDAFLDPFVLPVRQEIVKRHEDTQTSDDLKDEEDGEVLPEPVEPEKDLVEDPTKEQPKPEETADKEPARTLPENQKMAEMENGQDENAQDHPAAGEDKELTDQEKFSEHRRQVKKGEEHQKKIEEMVAEIAEEIESKLFEKLGPNERLTESLTVEATEDGVLISITDQFGFSMFQIGSAVPKGELVLAMQEISNILSKRDGKIRIYGHTDSRPYGDGNYDNWRLSTARAHSARYMLTRAGLADPRFSQVVGFADRRLREPNSPEADANRRIEILLEVS